ncbi:MAG: acyltransferase [Patescibacteria group bacterium]
MQKESKKPYFAHETSLVDEPATIGSGTKIWHFAHIMKGAKIGKNCSFGQNVYVGSGAIVGDNVKVQNNVSIYDGVTLEDYVFCGPSMVFTNDLNPRCKYPKHGHYVNTTIRYGASIGANVTVVCGHTIGRHAFIGSGSVVTKDIPDYALAFGNPAKIQGWMCECGTKLSFAGGDAQCATCKRKFTKKDTIIKEILK